VQLVRPDAPILRKVCRPDFTITADEINQMLCVLEENGGLGLAAPQVGIDARLFVTEWGEVFINPRVVGIAGPTRAIEGCLSLPGVTATIDRWANIRMADGRIYEGQRAGVILHEIDHLDGVLITDLPQRKRSCQVC
jgi:peptide deformylase